VSPLRVDKANPTFFTAFEQVWKETGIMLFGISSFTKSPFKILA
jgi:hypothetical protein